MDASQGGSVARGARPDRASAAAWHPGCQAVLPRGHDPPGGRQHRARSRLPDTRARDQPPLPRPPGGGGSAHPRRHQLRLRWRAGRRGAMKRLLAAAALGAIALTLVPSTVTAHPMGNFSISHYAAIRVLPNAVELRYVLDLAKIPTFQEMQDSGMVAERGHASQAPYLAQKAESLKRGLRLE